MSGSAYRGIVHTIESNSRPDEGKRAPVGTMITDGVKLLSPCSKIVSSYWVPNEGVVVVSAYCFRCC
jgi:hypothetical protein